MPHRPPTLKSPYSVSDSVPTARRERKELSHIDRMYHLAAWKRCRDTVMAMNPICQCLNLEGEQCRDAAVICHHIVSPYADATRFFDWRNLVAVCRTHHPNTEGEDLKHPNRYAVTQGILGASFDVNEFIEHLRGGRAA